MRRRQPKDPFHIGASAGIIIDSFLELGVIVRIVPDTTKQGKPDSIWVKLDRNSKTYSRRKNEVFTLDEQIHREIKEQEAQP